MTFALLVESNGSDDIVSWDPTRGRGHFNGFRKFYGRYGDLVEQYRVTLSHMLLNDILTLDQQ